MSNKKYLDFGGLSLFKSNYDREISDSISSDIELAIGCLDFPEISGANKYVSKISQTDGVIHAELTDLPVTTSWSATTSNASIPSEKLAKDSLDLKADLTNGTQVITAQEFNTTSSKKFKKCIVPSEVNAVDIINDTDIKDFFYKTDIKKKNPRVGFISEDTNPLLSTPSQSKMDISNCIGVLLKAVQELSKEVEELKAKLGE